MVSGVPGSLGASLHQGKVKSIFRDLEEFEPKHLASQAVRPDRSTSAGFGLTLAVLLNFWTVP